MNIEIITIGDEIMIGQILDTNSAWMAVKLNEAGFSVKQITSIKDDQRQIMDAFDRAFERVDVVLVTGGLGPTKDDITKGALCEYFHTKLVYNEEVYANLVNVLSDRMCVINELTKTQALVPENCTIIQNKRGTAPITWFERNGKVLVSMPGVPYEMKGAMTDDVIPRLMVFFPDQPFIIHKNFLVYHYTESALAEKIALWEDELPSFLKLAYLPQWGIIRLRITGIHASQEVLSKAIKDESARLNELLKGDVLSDADNSVEEIVGNQLIKKELTFGTAESCTGGAIAQKITSVPGCSSYYKGSVVAYSNEVKMKMLDVKSQTLEKYGSVSEETVVEMARGLQKNLVCDCAIAVSGIAGPSGGTVDKPVGTICVAVCLKNEISVNTYHWHGGRESNINRTVNSAMTLFLEMLLKKK